MGEGVTELSAGYLLNTKSSEALSLPSLSSGAPSAGRRVKVTPTDYVGTQIYHTVYLPETWKPDGARMPIIFEYTGNYHPKSGATGEVQDAGLGFGLSGGKYIWIALPYIAKDRLQNEVTWWGDTQATVDYAKQQVPKMVEAFNADPHAVFLCGFSRGAIGVNFLGLHDDEIARLWSAFITHDHFDGVREWKVTDWGSPIKKYREEAAERLRRVKGRPYLVIQNIGHFGTQEFVQSVFPSAENFTFRPIKTREIFGSFPHPLAKAAHTDRWLLLPSKYRQATWNWMNEVVRSRARNERHSFPLDGGENSPRGTQ